MTESTSEWGGAEGREKESEADSSLSLEPKLGSLPRPTSVRS